LITAAPNVNISGCINLEFLILLNSNINDFSEFVNLELLDVTNCNLTTINLTGLNNLKTFRCDYNQITDLNLSGLHNLEEINCVGNLLTSLDLYGLTNLVSLNCSNNLLTNLNIKNGAIEEVILDGNPNLEFICADELQIPIILQQYPSLNGHISSYCTFTPGGNYNTITGKIKYDFNNNGCDANDSVKPNIRMNITNNNTNDASFTNNAGNYAFFTQAGTFTLTPDIENPSWYNFSPNTAEVVFADNNNNIMLQNFCIVPNGVHPDLEVVISSILRARPGFNAVYQITYKNKGNQTQNGVVTFTFDDEKIDFVSATQSPDLQNIGSLQWDFGVLKPFESRTIVVTLHINSPTDTIPVTIGDILGYNVSLETVEVDETPTDNQFTFNQTVVGSYDPNDITCLEGNSLPPSEIGNYLHYAINFENTGNYPAENIVVKTEVDATKFDINSLQLLATSNAVDARITGNKVEFIFKNIQLPIGGHGHILLKVKSKATLVLGDSVAKRADIFFDYNAPIDTGFANTTFQTLSNTIFETDTTINVYPNPTTSKITINSDFDIKSIQVYDVQGRILETLIGANKILDISNKANGVYFLKITTNKGSKIEKVIKK
jgi:Secretion system C-terminal sorting domain